MELVQRLGREAQNIAMDSVMRAARPGKARTPKKATPVLPPPPPRPSSAKKAPSPSKAAPVAPPPEKLDIPTSREGKLALARELRSACAALQQQAQRSRVLALDNDRRRKVCKGLEE